MIRIKSIQAESSRKRDEEAWKREHFHFVRGGKTARAGSGPWYLTSANSPRVVSEVSRGLHKTEKQAKGSMRQKVWGTLWNTWGRDFSQDAYSRKSTFLLIQLPVFHQDKPCVAGRLLSYGRGVQFFTKWVIVGRIRRSIQQVFFTSRTKPAELRKSVPRRVLFPFAFGRIMNLVKTDLPSISTIYLGCEGLTPVVC
ncbi:hypothetical protein TNCV_2773571 [Trichonephila clavipes]|nr:hypothetical protein TNCV_2773571 [Trichonephila clavipes]